MSSSDHTTQPAVCTTRRDFIKVTTMGTSAFAIGGAPRAFGESAAPNPPAASRKGSHVAGLQAKPLDVVRWGVIGVGARGTSILRTALQLEDCEFRALCDIHKPSLHRATKLVKQAGRPAPTGFSDGKEAYRKLLERDDIDAVFICTPWRWHVPMAIAALQAGKHAFVEVPAALTLEECWQLVEAAEQAQLHCMMLENACYGREELMVLRMCREQVFGELFHGEGAYLHDVTYKMHQVEHGSGSWQIREHEIRNGNLYPTHGLGPIAQCMNINRGDRFDRMVSFSSPALGLKEYAREHFPPEHPRNKARYLCGDMNTSTIKTERGRTIVVQFNVNNPRPYSRGNLIQGTRGLFAGHPNRIFVEEEEQQQKHAWETDLSEWYAKFEHPLWKQVGTIGKTINKNGIGTLSHGGMDFVMCWRIVQCLKNGLPMDQDVYDAVTWSAIGPLSEHSVARNGAPVEVPDFTRGAWKEMVPLGIVS